MKNDCNKTIEAEYKQSLPAKLSIEKFAYIYCLFSKQKIDKLHFFNTF